MGTTTAILASLVAVTSPESVRPLLQINVTEMLILFALYSL